MQPLFFLLQKDAFAHPASLKPLPCAIYQVKATECFSFHRLWKKHLTGQEKAECTQALPMNIFYHKDNMEDKVYAEPVWKQHNKDVYLHLFFQESVLPFRFVWKDRLF